MKRYIFSIALLAGLHTYAQPLFTYGPKSVSKEEFLRQFNRNLDPAEDRVKALKDYLPLYINYKLKVQDAYDKRIDTGYMQLAELSDFRRQIEDNYFSQQANLDDLVKEAAFRSTKDIHLQDISIGFNPANPLSVDSAAANADNAYKKLQAGVSFEKVAAEAGTDAGLKASNANLGWITVFSLPYRIENEVYNLPLNGYTPPIRTRNAYHIFKKSAERKAVGKVKVAQIFFPFPPGATAETVQEMQHRADSLYEVLHNGADFSQLAQQVSLDKTSYQNGGELQEFGIGTYEKAFEDNAFALQQKGDVGRPFTTSYGIHILKLLDKIAVGDTTDATAINTLRQRVAADNRMEGAKTALVKRLLPKIGYQPNKLLKQADLWQYTDSSLARAKTPLKVTDKTELFRFTKQSVKAADWLKYVTISRNSGQQKSYTDLMEQYLNATAAEYYKKHLEDYNTEFKNQLQEFRDANLNFEVTQKMVWEKATADSVGLLRFYNTNKAKYQWGPSVNAIIVTATNPAAAEEARRQMESHIGNWRSIVSSMETRLMADSNRFEQGQIPVPPNVRMQLLPKTFTPMVLNPQDSSMTFSYVIDVINQPGQRSFEEARGFVINDYQQLLETRWMEALKKKYPVKMNTAVWNAMLKN